MVVLIKIVAPIHYTIEYKTKKDKTILLGMNWYRDAHYMLKNKVKRWFKRILTEQIVELKPFKKKISIHYVYYLKRKGTDLNNVHSVISKFFPDAIVELGRIRDDTVEYIPDSRETFGGYDKENPRAEIFISVYDDDKQT